MRRGFKAYAERLAAAERTEFKLSPIDTLDPRKYLRTQNILVWSLSDIAALDAKSIKQLTKTDPSSWSGITLCEGGLTAIIINPVHDVNRHASTLMHEWAHIKLGHKPNRLDGANGGLMLLSDYPPDIEEEADWLGAAMLLPREGLLHFRSKGATNSEIALHYEVSEQLVRWRIGTTGIDRQIGARRKRY